MNDAVEHDVLELVVNGEATTLADVHTVGELVDVHAETRRGVAVAVNAEIVPRSRWDQTPLRPGDRVEILGAAQGG